MPRIGLPGGPRLRPGFFVHKGASGHQSRSRILLSALRLVYPETSKSGSGIPCPEETETCHAYGQDSLDL